jgi:ATP-dependent Clp protease ATP-binding subunit ClpC
MFERFTDRARRAITLASQEALRLRHDHVGTEHLLLGIVKEGSGLASVVLEQFTVGLSAVRQKVEELCHGPSSGPMPPKLRQTERYGRVLGYAIDEANALSNNYVGTEHLLLGLLREPEGTAAKVLAAMNLRLEDVRNAVLQLLGKAPRSIDALVNQAVKDLQARLSHEMLSSDKLKAVAETLVQAGWRPQQ